MARITQDDFSGQTDANNENKIEIDAIGRDTVEVPNSQFISDSDISRDGQDLVLENPDGQTLVIQHYFNADSSPLIESADGSILTENLVNSFLKSDPQFAQQSSLNDESPVGAVEEISGDATVLRVDGTSEPLTLGTPIYQGDTIETSETGAVNVMFIDETSMAVSENARLSVDEYQYDPSTENGTTNLSVLRGVFVFTSGFIGRDDPDDVLIDTPVGSIGIRGTIIAGNISPGGESEITVVEGAIVVKNGAMDVTLSQQYESVRLGGFNDHMHDVGVQSAADVGKTYGSVQDVVPKLFSSINDNIEQEQPQAEETAPEETEEVLDAQEEVPEVEELQEEITPDPIMDQLIDTEFNNELGVLPLNETDNKNHLKEEDRFNKERHLKDSRELGDDQINPELLGDGPLTISHGPMRLFEGLKDGQVVGRVNANGGADGPVSFKFANGLTTSADGNFDIVQVNGKTAEIRLTTAGKSALDAGSIGSPLGSGFNVVITDQDGSNSHAALNPHILDSVLNLNTPGGLNFNVKNGINFGPQKIGDFNGDGVQDHVIVNATANTLDLIDGSTNSPIGSQLSAVLGINHNTVDGIGDVNNDGYADFAYGAPDAMSGDGFVNIVHGSSGGISPTGSGTGSTGDKLGHSVSGIGDFDGDGKSDYAFSALEATLDKGTVTLKLSGGNHTITGHAPTMKLGAHIDGLGDINGDGLSDLIVSAQNTVGGNYEAYIIQGGTTPTTTAGAATKISTPHEIVAGGAAGDLNGDGFDDIAISLKMGSDVNTFIIFGNNTLPSTIDIAYLEDPANALKIHHAGAGLSGDYEITALGDHNCDGFDDIQLGIVDGEQYIVHGKIAGDGIPYVTDNSASDGDAGEGKIQATANNQSLVGDTHFIDNTYTGLSMKGGDGRNDFSIQSNQFRNIDGGAGVEDTIRYGVNGGTLDFSNVNFEQISQVERIHFSQDTATIKLTAENIFNLLKTSDNGSLTIELGSSGGSPATAGNLQIDDLNTVTGATIHDKIVDTLNEDGSGAIYSGVVDGNHHYQIGGYNLYIDTDVTTTVV